MRSEYVFAATREISNRFLLCRMASVSARRLQIGSRHTSETINQSLQLIASAELTGQCSKDTGNDHCQEEAVAAAMEAHLVLP
jgi:hypothetical protein